LYWLFVKREFKIEMELVQAPTLRQRRCNDLVLAVHELFEEKLFDYRRCLMKSFFHTSSERSQRIRDISSRRRLRALKLLPIMVSTCEKIMRSIESHNTSVAFSKIHSAIAHKRKKVIFAIEENTRVLSVKPQENRSIRDGAHRDTTPNVHKKYGISGSRELSPLNKRCISEQRKSPSPAPRKTITQQLAEKKAQLLLLKEREKAAAQDRLQSLQGKSPKSKRISLAAPQKKQIMVQKPKLEPKSQMRTTDHSRYGGVCSILQQSNNQRHNSSIIKAVKILFLTSSIKEREHKTFFFSCLKKINVAKIGKVISVYKRRNFLQLEKTIASLTYHRVRSAFTLIKAQKSKPAQVIKQRKFIVLHKLIKSLAWRRFRDGLQESADADMRLEEYNSRQNEKLSSFVSLYHCLYFIFTKKQRTWGQLLFENIHNRIQRVESIEDGCYLLQSSLARSNKEKARIAISCIYSKAKLSKQIDNLCSTLNLLYRRRTIQPAWTYLKVDYPRLLRHNHKTLLRFVSLLVRAKEMVGIRHQHNAFTLIKQCKQKAKRALESKSSNNILDSSTNPPIKEQRTFLSQARTRWENIKPQQGSKIQSKQEQKPLPKQNASICRDSLETLKREPISLAAAIMEEDKESSSSLDLENGEYEELELGNSRDETGDCMKFGILFTTTQRESLILDTRRDEESESSIEDAVIANYQTLTNYNSIAGQGQETFSFQKPINSSQFASNKPEEMVFARKTSQERNKLVANKENKPRFANLPILNATTQESPAIKLTKPSSSSSTTIDNMPVRRPVFANICSKIRSEVPRFLDTSGSSEPIAQEDCSSDEFDGLTIVRASDTDRMSSIDN
jgi:hypothetical protein